MNIIKKGLVGLIAIIGISSSSAITIDGGWEFDTVQGANNPSQESPYVFSLAKKAVFSITDAFVQGDNFMAFASGKLILETFVGAGAAFAPSVTMADQAWESGVYSICSVVLGPGDYEIDIVSDLGSGFGGAGFYVRLDSYVVGVPDSGSTLVLLGAALLGFVAIRRRA